MNWCLPDINGVGEWEKGISDKEERKSLVWWEWFCWTGTNDEATVVDVEDFACRANVFGLFL